MRSLLPVFLPSAVACSVAAPPPVQIPARPETSAANAPTPAVPLHWMYDGELGPEHWGSLAASCGGKRQSPIDLPAPATLAAGATATLASLHEAPVPLKVVHNGHSIQVDDTVPSSVVHDGVTYDLAQFHFHSPSEHTIGGVSFDAEVHLVHQSNDGKLLVIGVLFKQGAANSVLKSLWDTMPTAPTKKPIVVAGQTVDVQALLPRSGRYAHYDGSLTVPPCTENVQWFVALPEGLPATELSAAQIAKLRRALGPRSNRPVQPTNGRASNLVIAK